MSFSRFHNTICHPHPLRRLLGLIFALVLTHSSDFENKFVCGEIMSYDDLKEYGSEAQVKAAGKLRQQGKPCKSIDLIVLQSEIHTLSGNGAWLIIRRGGGWRYLLLEVRCLGRQSALYIQIGEAALCDGRETCSRFERLPSLAEYWGRTALGEKRDTYEILGPLCDESHTCSTIALRSPWRAMGNSPLCYIIAMATQMSHLFTIRIYNIPQLHNSNR